MTSQPGLVYSIQNEISRLRSFQNWPVPDIVAPEDLARSGFYYLKQDDKAKCVFCGGIIEKWERGDNPDQEHTRHFPECPFVQSTIQPRLQEREDTENPNLGPNVSFDSHGRAELGINVHRVPYQPDYMTLSARLRTFSMWPKALAQTPKTLAEAGFYYQGNGDRVQCFSCGGGFKDWDPQDDPWTEHAKWFPKCNYVVLVKGPQFIEKCRIDTSKNNTTLTMDSGHASSESLNSANSTVSLEDTSVEASTSSKSLPPEEVNRLLKESRLCKICMAEEVGVVFLPCGHLAVCVNCTSNLKTCPICRSTIKGTVRTFLS